MKHLTRLFAMCLSLLLSLSVLTACGSDAPEETGESTPKVTTPGVTVTYDPSATLPPVTVDVSAGGSVATPTASGTTPIASTTADSTAASTPPQSSTEPSSPVGLTVFTESASQILSGAEEIDGTVVLRYSISYPTFTAGNGASPDALNAAVKAAAEKFETYALEELLPFAEQAQEIGDSTLPYTFSVDYDVAISTATAVSVVFTKTEHAGETREAYSRSACMFSPQTNSVLSLSNVFSGGASTYTETIYGAVFAKIAQSPNSFYADYENLARFFSLSDRWYLGDRGVVIFFNPFEIAAYDAGIVEFVLPYAEFSDALKINPLYMG